MDHGSFSRTVSLSGAEHDLDGLASLKGSYDSMMTPTISKLSEKNFLTYSKSHQRTPSV
jgi:hypothetical protein